VGGGPSLAGQVDCLRAWEGDLWAINGAWGWCRDHGINAYFFSIDPAPEQVQFSAGSKRTILSDHTHPSVWDAVQGEVWRAQGPYSGPTSAVAASVLAIRSGYDGATFFGCEGSYPGEGLPTHVYPSPERSVPIRVQCGSNSFLIKVELIMQTEQLADVIRTLPDRYSEESGGLLRALVKHGDYDVTHVTRGMMASFEEGAIAFS
tara:strand:- start:9243 stop:9857 length:615 start_codon:yes stop_codon:yes gene_type:complete